MVGSLPWRYRRALLALADALAWAGALTASLYVRYDLEQAPVSWRLAWPMIGLAVGLQLALGRALHTYQGRHRLGSADEAVSLAATVGAVSSALLVTDLLATGARPLPLSVVVSGAALALVLMGGVRLGLRAAREKPMRPRQAQPALVFGAGHAGSHLVRSMLLDAHSPYRPVGFLDDDPGKRHLRVSGVRVLGTRRDIAGAAARTGAETLVVAVPGGGPELHREVAAAARDAELTVKVLPPLDGIFARTPDVHDVRELDLTDLLGRRQIDTDIDAVAGYLTGRRVLVTGAGGSIGSELCRQIHRFGPAELVMLDRDESALHAVQLSIHGRSLLDSDEVVLADIRDRDAVLDVFERRRPEVVFHAAALKHLPMLEQYPEEGWKTNVLGTLHVLEAAEAAGVQRFVNISTDKAAAPTSVLGFTKRVAERLTAGTAQQAEGTYLSVRFGNVLGSRGSVLTAFTHQIAVGGPVTVTHPDVTRFFMTVAEAVQLTVQAAALGDDGEVLVLDMGEPVRILDVARQLISLAERPIEIVFTGLREGEKLTEELFATGEVGERRVHPLVSHVDVPPLLADDLPAVTRHQPAHVRALVAECARRREPQLTRLRHRVTPLRSVAHGSR